MEIYHTATQQLSLSKNLVFSLKILALNSYDLFRLVEEEALCNPALIFLNQKKYKRVVGKNNVNLKEKLEKTKTRKNKNSKNENPEKKSRHR